MGAAAIAGCRPSSSRSNPGGVLRYPIVIEPSTFDPAKVTESASGDLLQNIYEGLVGFDENCGIVGRLADHWTVGAGGREYTFFLQPNARFHNGQSVTASDVKYSLERALRPETKAAQSISYLGEIEGAAEVASGKRNELAGATVIGEHTIRLRLQRARGYFLETLAYHTGDVVCREAIEKNGNVLDEKAAIGTGPFKLMEYRHGSKVMLQANRDYYGKKPAIGGIERRIVIDPQTSHVMFEDGELDICGIAAADLARDEQNPALRSQIRYTHASSLMYLAMLPQRETAFRDLRVRKAIAMAIDRDEIARVAGRGLWQRADGLLPPGIPGWTKDFKRLPLDPAGSRRLLAASGYPGGRGFPTLVLVYPHDRPERAAAAQLIRDSLKRELGIGVDLQEREQATFISDRRAEKMAFYMGAWEADYPDPQNFLSTLLRTGTRLNNFGYSNPEVDSLCDRADAETDQAKRIELYRKADQLAMDEVALFPLVYPKSAILVKPNVTGLRINALGFLPQTETTIAPSP